MIIIRKQLVRKKIWVSIDETINISGRHVANAIVGILSTNIEENHIYLLNTQYLEKVNCHTIARFLDDSIKLRSESFNRDDVLLLITLHDKSRTLNSDIIFKNDFCDMYCAPLHCVVKYLLKHLILS